MSTPVEVAVEGPVEFQAKAPVMREVFIEPSQRKKIEKESTAWFNSLIKKGINTPDFKSAISEVSKIGSAGVKESTEVTSRLLNRPVALAGKDSPSAKVGNDLVALRIAVGELDPSRADLTGLSRVLKVFPSAVRRRTEQFLHRASSANDQLTAIDRSLTEGQDQLNKDNLALALEREELWKSMGEISEAVLYLEKLVKVTKDEIQSLRESGNEQDARALESDVLFALNQRHQDLLTQASVNSQGYLTLDVIQSNNEELVKGVERAKTTTMSALRVSIMSASALDRQKAVLNQTQMVNDMTSGLVVKNSERLLDQAGDISKMAASTTINLEALETAYGNVAQTLDALDNFRAEANPYMEDAVRRLESQVDESASHLERSRARG